MNEANVNLADRLTAEEAEPSLGHRAHSGVEELATTRLPPVPHPPLPPPSRVPSHPPQAAASIIVPPSEAAHGAAASFRPPPHTSTSWWRGLLTSTIPPAGEMATAFSRVHARRLAMASGAAAALLFVVALIIGLWGAPSGFLMPPVVAAALVLARALVALGMLSYSITLLRVAERFLLSSAGDELKRS